MKQLARSALFVAFALVGGVRAASTEARTFNIDRSHSEVGFNIRHFFTKVHGQFNDYNGTIVYDPKNIPASSVEVVVRDSSIYTANERRDADLRSENFFWVEKYPTITFKSTKVTPKDSTHFQVAGDLTIRGVTKPVVLEVEQLGMGSPTIGGREMGTRAGFAGTTKIDRKDFGIVWNRAIDQGGLMLGDEVEIVLNVEAASMPKPQPQPSAPAGQKR